MGDEAEGRDQQVDQDLDATFGRLEGGPSSPPDAGPGLPEGANTACMELEAQVTELRTRLSLLEQSHAVASKERDAADEARRKLETTLTEFLSRFNAVREQQAAAFQEVNKLKAAALEAQNKATNQGAELAAAQKARDETAAELGRERAAAAAAREELKRFQEAAVAALEPLGKEHSRSMTELIGEADAVAAEARQVRDDANERLDKLEQTLAEFKTRVSATNQQMSQRLATVLQGSGAQN